MAFLFHFIFAFLGNRHAFTMRHGYLVKKYAVCNMQNFWLSAVVPLLNMHAEEKVKVALIHDSSCELLRAQPFLSFAMND